MRDREPACPEATGLLRRRQALCGLALLAGAPRLRAQTLPPLHLVASDFPELISPSAAEPPGPLGQYLVELCAEAGWQLQPEFMPFARAKLMAQRGPRVISAPIGRTPDREQEFRWLLPLYTQRYLLFGLKRHWPQGITLEAARQARTLTLRGSLSGPRLRREGFRQVHEDSSYPTLLRRLDAGTGELLYAPVTVLLPALKAARRDPGLYAAGPGFDSNEIWLVGSPDLGDADVSALQAAQERLRERGRHARLLQQLAFDHPAWQAQGQ